MNGFLVASPKSGGGKTIITCALLKAAKRRGREVRAFKCGPDFIDPMFHRSIPGTPSENLDLFFQGEGLGRFFGKVSSGFDLVIVEGVMGLFDGTAADSSEESSYDIASRLGLPVLLCVDARGSLRSVLPMIRGFLDYDEDRLIAGVFLNRITRESFRQLKGVIERELGLPVFGFLPEREEFRLESRHLGLKLPEENPELKERIAEAAGFLEETAELDALFALPLRPQRSLTGREGERGESGAEERADGGHLVNITQSARPVTIALARDEAFCFLYEENLRVLKRLGARLVPFSPVHDTALPENTAGIIFPGGYPELHAKELSDNTAMLGCVRRALLSGMPSVAECGGFLYLHRRLVLQSGESFPMAGLHPFDAVCSGRNSHFGYLSLTEKEPDYLGGKAIRGHEFHYFASEAEGEACRAEKKSGRHWDCIVRHGDGFWGFPHLYYPSAPVFAESFLKRAGNYASAMKGDHEEFIPVF